MKISGKIIEVDKKHHTLLVEIETNRRVNVWFQEDDYGIEIEMIYPGDTLYANDVEQDTEDMFFCPGLPLLLIRKDVEDVLKCFPNIPNREKIYRDLYRGLYEMQAEDLKKVYYVLSLYTERFFWRGEYPLQTVFEEKITVKEEAFFYRRWYQEVLTRQANMLGVRSKDFYKVGVSLADLPTIVKERPQTLFHLNNEPWLKTLNPELTKLDQKAIECGKYVHNQMVTYKHAGVPLESILKRFRRDPEAVIEKMVEEYHFTLFPTKRGLVLSHHRYFKPCEHIAKYLVNLQKEVIYKPKRFRFSPGITDEQREAVRTAMRKSVTIITGGAGTGKTRTLGELVKNLELNEIKYHIMTFTGKASSRIRSLTGYESHTIHRTLSDFPDDIQHVIIDETSMMETLLFGRFIRHANSVRQRFKITFIGDKNQLEPIGFGTLFAEMIKSEVIPVSTLTENFRFANGTKCMIIRNAEEILNNSGVVHEKNNFMMMEPGLGIVRQTILALKERGMKHDEFYILSPTNKPLDQLNMICQSIFTKGNVVFPDPKDKNKEWRIGDRVMVTVNNYEDRVFNGEEGTIVAFDYPHMVILFPDPTEGQREVRYKLEYLSRRKTGFDGETDELFPEPTCSLSDLKLSYAVTIDKCQGDQKKYILFYYPPGLFASADFMNSVRLYTGVTRCETLFFFIGNKKRYLQTMCTPPKIRCEVTADLLKYFSS